jgi:hypothetical protein
MITDAKNFKSKFIAFHSKAIKKLFTIPAIIFSPKNQLLYLFHNTIIFLYGSSGVPIEVDGPIQKSRNTIFLV